MFWTGIWTKRSRGYLLIILTLMLGTLVPLKYYHHTFNFPVHMPLQWFFSTVPILTENESSARELNMTCFTHLLGPGYNTTRGWVPHGNCKLNNYTHGVSDIERCFDNIGSENQTREIWFIGDSRMRCLFSSLVARVLGVPEDTFEIKVEKRGHNPMDYIEPNSVTHMRLYWDNVLEFTPTLLNSTLLPKGPKPAFVVLSACLHYMTHDIRTGDLEGKIFKWWIEKHMELLEKVIDSSKTKVIWMLNGHINETSRLIWAREKNEERKRAGLNTLPYGKFTNQRIDFYNNLAVQYLKNTSVLLWESASAIADIHGDFRQGSIRNYTDFGHAGPNTLNQVVDVLLNLLCYESG